LTASSCLYDVCARCCTELLARRRALHPLRLSNEGRKIQSDISNLPPTSHALCKLRHKQNVTYAAETFVCLHKISIIPRTGTGCFVETAGGIFFFLPSGVRRQEYLQLPSLYVRGTEIDRHTMKMGAVCPSETLAAGVTTA